MKILAIFVLLASIFTIDAHAVQKKHRSKRITVTMENMKFSPETLSLSKGDVIIFENKDLVPHTATANDKSFGSGSIEPGKKWTLKVKTAGTIPYKCVFHPQMTATLEVQ